MSYIELVIKIPEENYKKDNLIHFFGVYSVKLDEVIKNGTPLPKGHGRLGDLDAIWNELKELEDCYRAEFLKKSNVIHESAMNGRLYGFTNSKFIVQDAPTIIEADKENT